MNNRTKEIAKSIAGYLMSSTFIGSLDEKSAAKTFFIMLHFAELNPLLNIIYYAGQQKFPLKENEKNQLSIIIDLYNKDLETLTLGSCKDKVSYLPQQNTIYVAGKQSNDTEENKKLVQRSLLYGATLFVIHEVFQNKGKPYFVEEADKQTIDAICAKIATDGNTKWLVKLDQDQSKISAQILANVTAWIWQHGSSYPTQQRYPELMSYYQDNFLPACQLHLKELGHEFHKNSKVSCLMSHSMFGDKDYLSGDKQPNEPTNSFVHK